MSIIAETILGIILFFAVVIAVLAFGFKDEWTRLLKYIQLWQADDARREKVQKKLDDDLRSRLQEQEMLDAAAREKAEAEIEQSL